MTMNKTVFRGLLGMLKKALAEMDDEQSEMLHQLIQEHIEEERPSIFDALERHDLRR